MSEIERELRAAGIYVNRGSPSPSPAGNDYQTAAGYSYHSDGASSNMATPNSSHYASPAPMGSPNTTLGRGERRRSGKHVINLRVLMLDDTMHSFDIERHSTGKRLLEACCTNLNIYETDYFGIEYSLRDGKEVWLDNEKVITKQVSAPKKTLFKFSLKFYSPDPGQLQDDFTKYLFSLQIKRDLAMGRLPCSDNTVALLASYILQAEVGDFNPAEHGDGRYISHCRFVPHQNPQIEAKILEYHKNHTGQTPADADFSLLDIARRLEMYGVRPHPAKDHDGVRLDLAVAHMGILVFHNNNKINTFSWAKIRKLSFKQKRFLVKLHQEGYGYFRDVVEFYLASRNECKRFWKTAVEHHTFFRLQSTRPSPQKQRVRIFSRGSSFSYSGRTHKQVVEDSRQQFKRPNFQRYGSRVSARSLGAPRTTTPLRFEPEETRISERQHVSSNPELNFSQDHSRENLTSDFSTFTPPASQKGLGLTYDPGMATSSPLSVSPVTSPELNSRITVVPGDTSDSVMYEYSVTDRPDGQPPAASPATATTATTAAFASSPTAATAATAAGYTVSLERNGRSQGSAAGGQSSLERRMASTVSAAAGRTASLSRSEARKGSPIRVEPPRVPSMAPPPPPPPEVTDGYGDMPQSPPVPLTPHLNAVEEMVNSQPNSEEDGTRRKRHPTDKAYFIAKEVLTTERTYLKDLEVIVVWFRKFIEKELGMPVSLLQSLFSNMDPLYEFHCGFVRDIEQRLALWEGRSNAHLKGNYQRIGDIMWNHLREMKKYLEMVGKQEQILQELEATTRKNKKFELVYKEFETQKVCYLPLNTFLLKPGQRILHYKLILERLLRHSSPNSADYTDCKDALYEAKAICARVEEGVKKLENFQKLTELQRDLVGVDKLVQPQRMLIREGCLHKLSRKGYQQRMFFLFSDILLYTSKGVTQTNQFKVHGQVGLQGVTLQDSEQDRSVPNCFTVHYGNHKTLVLAANSAQEKDRWMADIQVAMSLAEKHVLSLNSTGLFEAVNAADSTQDESEDDVQSPRGSLERQAHHRANTTMHVCWHRSTSVSMTDHNRAVHSQLSGYLLRKFKNSSGWQKLWVVFTNFCLFFYKTYQDDFPLASLPLLGYTVSTPSEEDDIHKDYVFKLQFKTHVYFFRAESEYTFGRWMEVLGSATYSAKYTVAASQ